MITNEHTTSEQLTSVPIKNLRAYLIHSKIVSTNQLETYFEKKDLIDLIQLPKKGRIGQSNASFVRESNLSNTQALNNNARRAATTNTINVETVQESAINTNEQVYQIVVLLSKVKFDTMKVILTKFFIFLFSIISFSYYRF